MSQILAMTHKEILLWLKRPGSWVIVFVVPILFIWIVQAVFGSPGAPAVAIYAVNEDESQAGQQVMEALRAADQLLIEELETRQESDRRVGTGERMAALIVPEGFSGAMMTSRGATIEIIVDPARSEQVNIVIGLVNAALAEQMVQAEVSRSVEASVAAALDSFERGEPPGELDQENEPVGEQDQENGLFEDETTADESEADTDLETTDTTGTEPDDLTGAYPTPDSLGGNNSAGAESQTDLERLRTFFAAAVKGVVSSQVQEALAAPQIQVALQPLEETENARRPSLLDFLVPGYSLIFVYFLIPSLALTVIEERRMGMLQRLLVTPVSRSKILLGKMLPYSLIAAAQFVIVFTASWLLFGIDLGDSAVALAIVIFSSSLAMVGLGILIASFARSEGQADGIAIIIVLAMAVVSGVIFPNVSIPGLQLVTPQYWSMQGFLNVIIYGQGIPGVLGPTGILMTMAAAFFTAGAVRFWFE